MFVTLKCVKVSFSSTNTKVFDKGEFIWADMIINVNNIAAIEIAPMIKDATLLTFRNQQEAAYCDWPFDLWRTYVKLRQP